MKHLGLSLVYLAFLSLPGIVGSKVYRQLTRKPSNKTWEDFVEILLFGLLSYLVYAALCAALNVILVTNLSVKALETLKDIEQQQVAFHWGEILACCVVGLILGFVAACLENHKIVNRIGRCLGVTNQYGDEDVWEFFHNSKEVPSWAYVKDHKLGLLYFAQIVTFSDSGRDRELVLEDVKAYDIDSGAELFARDVIYLAREKYDLTIEIPQLGLDVNEDPQRRGEEREND